MSEVIANPTTSGNGLRAERLADKIKRSRSGHPGSEDVEYVHGTQTFHGLDELRRALGQRQEPPVSASAPSRKAQTAAQRRYCRAFIEVLQIASRPPAGTGKRLRNRLAKGAESFAEMCEAAVEMKAAKRM